MEKSCLGQEKIIRESKLLCIMLIRLHKSIFNYILFFFIKKLIKYAKGQRIEDFPYFYNNQAKMFLK